MTYHIYTKYQWTIIFINHQDSQREITNTYLPNIVYETHFDMNCKGIEECHGERGSTAQSHTVYSRHWNGRLLVSLDTFGER